MDRTWVWTLTMHTFLSLKVITHARLQNNFRIFSLLSRQCSYFQLLIRQTGSTQTYCSPGSNMTLLWRILATGTTWKRLGKGEGATAFLEQGSISSQQAVVVPPRLLKLKQLFALLGRLVRSFVKTHWLLQKRSSPFQYGPNSPFQYGPGFLLFLYKWSIFMNPSIFHLLSDVHPTISIFRDKIKSYSYFKQPMFFNYYFEGNKSCAPLEFPYTHIHRGVLLWVWLFVWGEVKFWGFCLGFCSGWLFFNILPMALRCQKKLNSRYT